MSVQFAIPYFLFFLWLVPLVGAWWYAVDRRREQRLSHFLSPAMQAKLRPAVARARFGWQAGLMLGALALLLVAAARPQWGAREEIAFQRGRDLVIALDVSRSMLAADVHPNRLQRAKFDIVDLIHELRGDRAALLAFRGKAALLCPLTTDYAFLKQALDGAGIESAPRGETDIGDAITKAMDAFEDESGAHKAIILISDGEDLTGRALEMAQKASERGIPIFTVGLGDRNGAPIPNAEGAGFMKHQGREVVTKLEHDTLYAIAEKTGGAYIPIATAGMANTTLGTLYRDHLRKVAARDLEESLQRRYIERYQWFLAPSFLCLLAAALMSRGRLCTRAPAQAASTAPSSPLKDLTPPPRALKQIGVTALLALAFAGSAGAATEPATAPTNTPAPSIEVPAGRAGAREAQRFYRLGRYAEAAEAYRQAAVQAGPMSQRDFRYNAAIALFKAGKFQEAADLFRDLTLTGKEADESAAIGLGSALFESAALGEKRDAEELARRAKALTDAGEAFKEAVRLRAQDIETRRNLGVVLQALPEAREQARIAKLMETYGQTPPAELAQTMLKNQRALHAEAMAAYTNETPAQITQLEALAKRQEANADLWVPLKGSLLTAMAGKAQDEEQQKRLASMQEFVESTREQMLSAATGMRNLDPSGFNNAVVAEDALYEMWKAVAPYPYILDEDIRVQTNAVDASVASPKPGEAAQHAMQTRQAEALELTSLFSKRFAEAVPAPESSTEPGPQPGIPMPSGAGGTNAPAGSISPETRAEIIDLAEQATAFQESAVRKIESNSVESALADQREALERLLKIRELLPKKSPEAQPQAQPQDKQDQQQDPQQQKQDQEQEQQQDQQKDQQQDQASSDKPDEPEKPKEEEAQPAEPKDEKKDEMSDQQLRQLLEKAMMREREHEAEKKRQRQHMPMSPSERDW